MNVGEIERIIEQLSNKPTSDVSNELTKFGLQSLDYIVKAEVIKGLLDKSHSKDELITKYLPMLGFQPSAAVLEGIIKVRDLPSKWHEYLVKREVNLKTILQLVKFPETLLGQVMPLIIKLEVGGYKLIRIIELVGEISQREDITPAQVIQEEVISKIVEDDNLSKPEKTSRISKHLFIRRMPIISELKRKFEERVRKIKLPNKIKIIPPENFEGRSWEIRLKFENRETLEKLNLEVQKLIDLENYKNIFESLE